MKTTSDQTRLRKRGLILIGTTLVLLMLSAGIWVALTINDDSQEPPEQAGPSSNVEGQSDIPSRWDTLLELREQPLMKSVSTYACMDEEGFYFIHEPSFPTADEVYMPVHSVSDQGGGGVNVSFKTSICQHPLVLSRDMGNEALISIQDETENLTSQLDLPMPADMQEGGWAVTALPISVSPEEQMDRFAGVASIAVLMTQLSSENGIIREPMFGTVKELKEVAALIKLLSYADEEVLTQIEVSDSALKKTEQLLYEALSRSESRA